MLLWAREGSWDSIGLGWLPGGLMETTCAVGVGGRRAARMSSLYQRGAASCGSASA